MLKSFLRRRGYILKQQARELAKYHPIILELGAWGLFGSACLKSDLSKRLETLNRAYGWANSRFLENWIHRMLREHLPDSFGKDGQDSSWSCEKVGWHRYRKELEASKAVMRTLMLKAPGPDGEKGVIVSYFE